MKHITRKIVAMLTSAVTAITTLSVSYSEAFAETSQEQFTSSSDTDYDLKSGGLLGGLMPNEFKSLAKENEEAHSSDYAVYKLEYDSNKDNLIISYSAKEDCTIFVGFYNDEGTQLYTSVTTEATAGADIMTAVKKPDGLPDHYLIKAFMVGSFSEPLTKPCVYEKCTKAVQDIIKTTPDQFDEKRVIKFNENDDYNFMVTKNECVKVYSDDTKDTIIENDDSDTYLFDNIDKIKDVKEGQDVLIYTPDDMDIFRVDSISIDGTKATIKKQNVDIHELVDFIKFDSSEYTGDVEGVYTANDSEDSVSCEVLSEPPVKSADSQNGIKRKPFPSEIDDLIVPKTTLTGYFRFNLLDAETKDSSISGKAYLDIAVEINVEVYFTSFVNILNGDITFKTTFEIEADFQKTIHLGKIGIKGCPISFSSEPVLNIKAIGEITLTSSSTYDFYCIPYVETIITKREEEEPEYTSANWAVTLEISFGLDSGINVVWSKICRLSIEPEIGIKIKLENSESVNNDYVRHDCNDCISRTTSFFVRVTGHLTLLGVDCSDKDEDEDDDKLKIEAGLETELKVDEAHISNGIVYDGPCDNLSHKIILHVKEVITDDKGKTTTKPVKGASVYSGSYISDDIKFVDDNGKDIITDDSGNVSLWIKDTELYNENYCVTVKTSDNKVTTVRVGRNWNPNLNKANEFEAVIDEESISIDPDAGLAYPISGNCGRKVDTMLETEEPVYENVTYDYFSDGECWVLGSGHLDGDRLLYELAKKNVNGIKKLLIGRGVNISNGTYLNSGIPIEAIECMGDNGRTLTRSCIPESLKEITLSDFEEIEYNAFYSSKHISNNTLRPLKVNFPNSIKVIGHDAFRSTDIEEVVFPKKLKRIESLAFAGCKNLTSIKLNEGLEEIKTEAFRNTNIKIVNIPKSVKNLEHQAFWNCANLKTVIINGDYIKNWVIPFDHSKIETLIMNDGVTKINDGFFSSQEELKTIQFSRNLKKIGNSAFIATSIENVNLPYSLEYIDNNAFYGAKIKSLTIPENVSYIGGSAFSNNPITSLKLSEGVSYIGESAFSSTKLSSVTIPESVSFIGAYAFNNGSYLNDIKLDSSSVNELSGITILNPNCNIEKNIVSKATTIYGYTGSSAEAYAKKYGNPFKALDTPAVTSTTAVTTVKTTTTTAAVVTTQVAPDSECVFIAVNDDKTVNGSADELLDRENVRFFDQQTANGDGVVSFSYLPDEKEKWAFIFVSEAINDTITKAFGTPDALKITTYNAAPGVKGDANGDGQVDMSDAVLIMQALANPNKYGTNGTNPTHITADGFKFADTDGNGLTVNDALRIQKYLLGLIKSFDE